MMLCGQTFLEPINCIHFLADQLVFFHQLSLPLSTLDEKSDYCQESFGDFWINQNARKKLNSKNMINLS